MKYCVSVYYAHGATAWQRSLDEKEVIYQMAAKWLWLARCLARSNLGNCGNTAYVIHSCNRIVEEGPGQRLSKAGA